MRIPLLVAGLLLPAVASATNIDPKCVGTPPAGDDVVQQDFLQNYVALSLSNSPLHAPIPDEAGHGHVGVQVLVIPPLGCSRRFVFDATKTEDTNKTPVAPKLQLGWTFEDHAGFVPYGSVLYVPPLPVAGTRNVILGGEVGVGRHLGKKVSAGLRFQAQMTKTVGDIATAFNPDDPAVNDLYTSSTWGLDVQAGYHAGYFRPYVSVGLLDVSTFFYVGDDGVVANNLHPYFGPDFGVGVDDAPTKSKLRWAAEFYGAPGGFSAPTGLPDVVTEKNFPGYGTYGHLYTARFSLGYTI